MKRKLISVSLALALGLSLAACGSKPAPSGMWYCVAVEAAQYNTD